MGAKPNFIIVGQPKSGTTAFYEYFRSHPDIFVPERKETHFFCHDFHEENARFHGSPIHFPIRTISEYDALFNDSANKCAIGEASVNYLFSGTSATEIHAYNPDMRILVFLRDPVDFLYSWHAHSQLTNGETIEDFAEALAAEPDRRRGDRLDVSVKVPSYLFYRERVKYAIQIKRFMDRFPREQIHFVVYEDFVADNIGIYREALRFLQVDDTVLPDFKVINPRKRLRFKSVARATKHPRFKRILNAILPKELRVKLGLSAAYGTVFLKPDAGKPLDSEFRQALCTEFRDDVIRTGELIGVDLAHKWGYVKP